MDKKDVYFTIFPKRTGFNDQLNQFSALYRMGRAMGFKYYHSDLISIRSSYPPINYKIPVFIEFQRFFIRLIRIIKINFQNGFRFNIFDFIGFNEYFGRYSIEVDPSQFEKIEILLRTDFVNENKVTSVSDYIRSINSIVSSTDSHKILLVFRVKSGRKFLRSISNSIPKNPDQLSLGENFINLKNNRRWTSKFDNEKIKVLVHIRKGDSSILKTPWNTYIKISQIFKKIFQESKNFHDLKYSNYFEIQDYKLFTEKLISHYGNDKFSLLFFSDGFKRAFSNLIRKNKEYKFTRYQIKKLIDMEKSYDEKAFKDLEQLKGAELIIGEDSDKLSALIYSIFEADIIITSSTSGMIKIFVENFFNINNMPFVIFFYKEKLPVYSYLTEEIVEKKIFFLDIEDPDYNKLFKKINSKISNN